MKTRNSPNLWEDTAWLPQRPNWEWQLAKRKRNATRVASQTRKPERIAKVIPTANPTESFVKSNISLASLGLNFNATRVAQIGITGK